jgi:hypothetical protein
MHLRVAGIYHFDPGCRARLLAWYHHLASTAQTAPVFVANEWSSAAFEHVKSQRRLLRELLKREWPQASVAVLDILSASLGYEGDAHEASFPDADILWLGSADRSSVNDYAKGRFAMYKGFLNNSALPSEPEAAVRALGSAARSVPIIDRDPQRDRDLAVKILDRLSGADGTWAAVAIGATHATQDDEAMVRLLQHHGVKCEVDLL